MATGIGLLEDIGKGGSEKVCALEASFACQLYVAWQSASA